MPSKVLILEDEEDILFLFRDYLAMKGYQIVCCCVGLDGIMENFEQSGPDICIIDYLLRNSENGIDAAIKILDKNRMMPILFITGYESFIDELPKYPILQDKNIHVLLKPVHLPRIDDTILSMITR